MNKDNNTLVILIPGFPESEADSTCLPMQQAFVRSLKKLNPELKIIILSFQYPYHTRGYKWYDIPVIPFSGRNKGGLKRLLLRKKINVVLAGIHKARKITGLISFWCTECAWVGKKFADKHGLKHLSLICGQDARRMNHYIKRMQPRSTELVAISDFLQEEFEKNHSIRPSFVTPPGIDPAEFSEKKLTRDIDVLGAGSLIQLKQYSIFLEIIYEVKKKLPAIKVMLCGDGPEKATMQTQLERLKLQNNVTLTGELAHPDLLELMQRTRLFLHSSSYEGFSGVCLEALHAGAHVISFCKAMNHEIEHWHIVSNKDEMIQKTLEILQNPHTEHKPVTPFTSDDSVRKIMQLLTG